MNKTVLLEKRVLPPQIIYLSNGKLETVELDDNSLTVGRITYTNKVDIDLKLDFVSRQHGMFGFDVKGNYYIDKKSTNGTYCNGRKLASEVKQYLNDGDILHIVNGNPDNLNDFVCMIYTTSYRDDWETAIIEIHKGLAEINIGRKGKRNVILDNPNISANHATFFMAKSGWAIVDNDSTNGVFINNKRIDEAKYLCVGDCIRIADVYFIYTGNSLIYQKRMYHTDKISDNTSSDGLYINIEERSVWHRAKKLMLLQNINISIEPKEMVMILGGSGAGKTTFMNAVMGYEKAKGRIMHGESDVYRDYDSMKYTIGFVPQQDLLRGGDSVYDTLENAARMKLGTSMKRHEREERINIVLSEMGLSNERDSLVSKLSGGQRKRLSIALEYIANPSLFFLDEPDSGVDGPDVTKFMGNLRHIADEGKIIMVITHTPDRISKYFDKVIVLAKNSQTNCGHLAYFGTINDAYEFFNETTLEGIVKRINPVDEGGEGMADYFIEKYNKFKG